MENRKDRFCRVAESRVNKIIKMLRMLDMPLEDIRRVLEREETITEAVARQRELLLARQRQLKAAVDMCDRIRRKETRNSM